MDTVNTKQNFAWTVKNPVSYLGVGAVNWTTQDTSSSYMWNDKNVTKNTDGKSIFDPSPIGWRLPINGAFEDFPDNVAKVADKVAIYTLGTTGAAKYYAVGTRTTTTGAFSGASTAVRHWLSTPFSELNATRLEITSSGCGIYTGYARSSAMPIRSVREN